MKRVDSVCTDAIARGASAPLPHDGQPACGGGFNRRGEILARAVPFERLTAGLSGWVDRIVVDETKLHGPYDWHLRWDPNATPQVGSELSPKPATPNDTAVGQQGVSLFTAIREQLGLELKPKREPIEVVGADAVA